MAKVLGIVGLSYCGSTALNMVLGSLPGVAGAGETHWIVDRPDIRCKACWRNPCPVFTEQLLAELRADQSDWWQRIAAAYGPGIEWLVTTDKSPAIYERLGWPDLLVVLYRNPIPWVGSWLAHNREHGRPGTAREGAALWEQFHRNMLDWMDTRFHELFTSCLIEAYPVFVCWDEFCDRPMAGLERLCNALGIRCEVNPWGGDAPTLEPMHQIGGNKIKHDRLQTGPDNRWKEVLTPGDAEAVAWATAETLRALRQEVSC